jgi:hypothetical protein
MLDFIKNAYPILGMPESLGGTSMTKNAKVALAAVVVIVLVVALVLFPFGKGNATGSDTCVPSPETTQTVVITPEVPAVPGTPEVPAVTQTIHHDAVVGPDLWWNWSPNKEQGPFDGPPSFPTDSRGTWEGPHENGGPSQDTYGTFQQGNGNGSWFHREHGVVITPAFDETVVITPAIPATPGTPAIPAVTQQVVTPAVTCDTPSETPTVTPTTPNENPQGPETPVSNPQPPKPPKTTPAPPKDVQVIECVDGVWVTTVNGEVISESGTCERDETNNTPQTFSETGL